mgnify:CR=1 FL=1
MKMVKKYWLILMLTTFVVSCRNSNVGVTKDTADQPSTSFYQTRTAEMEKVKKQVMVKWYLQVVYFIVKEEQKFIQE